MSKAYTGLILISHPGLAEALLEIASSIVGKLKTPVIVGTVPNDSDLKLASEDLVQQIAQHPSIKQWLILCDILGASPWNVACSVQTRCQAPIVTGLNLPMILRANNYSDRPALELGKMVSEGGINSVTLHPFVPS